MRIGGEEGERTIIVADKEQKKWSLFVLPAQNQTQEYLQHPVEGAQPTVGRPVQQLGDIHPALERGYYLTKVPFEIFLTPEFCSAGPCDLIIENPHLRFKNELSNGSQIFSLSELNELEAIAASPNTDLRIFEFPNALTRRARIEMGIEPYAGATEAEKNAAKKCDTEAICWFVLNRSNVRLKQFDSSRQIPTSTRHDNLIILSDKQRREVETREYLSQARRNSSERLNIMRTLGYSEQTIRESQFNSDIWAQIDHALRILDQRYGNVDPEALSNTAVSDVFGIVRKKNLLSLNDLKQRIREHNEKPETATPLRLYGTKTDLHERLHDAGVLIPSHANGIWRGKKKPREYPNVSLSYSAIMAVYVSVFADLGIHRTRTIGGQDVRLGVDFIWTRLLMMTPYHGRLAGVARANLMYANLAKRFELTDLGDEVPGENIQPSRRYILEDQTSGRTERRQAERKKFRNAVKELIRVFKNSDVPYSQID